MITGHDHRGSRHPLMTSTGADSAISSYCDDIPMECGGRRVRTTSISARVAELAAVPDHSEDRVRVGWNAVVVLDGASGVGHRLWRECQRVRRGPHQAARRAHSYSRHCEGVNSRHPVPVAC